MKQVKYYLVRAVRNFLASLPEYGITPLSDDYKVEFLSEHGNSIQIKVFDPHQNAPRYFEIKVIEKM